MGHSRSMPGAKRLSAKLVSAITVVVAVCAVAFLAWAQSNQEEAIRSKVLAEARTLNTEMRGVGLYR